MNKFLHAKYVLSFSLLFTCLAAVAQTEKTPPLDDEFNVFLFSIVAVFACAMIGAAIVGAFVAALFFFSVTTLIGFGIVSTSVAVGLYKRSATAGFKALLVSVFGIGCAFCGTVMALLLHHFYPTPLPSITALGIGLVAGAFGGCVIGLSTFSVIKALIQNIYRRFSSVS